MEFLNIHQEFLASSEGRAIKMITEFLNAKSRLEKENIKNTIVMFGSARIKSSIEAQQQLDNALQHNEHEFSTYEGIIEASKFYEAARELSNKFAIWSKQQPSKFYLCSGGGGGIMEACNRGAFEAGEKTIGFNITLPFEQHPNKYITKELNFNFNYFFIRKFWFSYLAKAFVVFPGGFGTMDELFEVLTLMQTRKMQKKIPIVLFGKEFFNGVFNPQLMKYYGLISENDDELYLITDSIEEAFTYITNHITAYE